MPTGSAVPAPGLAVGRLVPTRARLGRRGALTLVLVAAFLASLAGIDWSRGLLHTGGGGAFVAIARSLLTPEVSPGFLAKVAAATALTVAYAVAGMSVAVIVGLPGAVVASGVLARRRLPRVVSAGAARAVMAVLRAIDEIIWALLFVSVLGLTPAAGVLAIGLPYGATVARVVAERLQDVPGEPLEALRTAGASEWQVLAYGRLPAAIADVAGYLFYRFECALRAAAILSFIGLGGIGFQIDIALADLAFERVWTLLFALVVVIAGVDAVSARLRGRLSG
jgi:phosphonate transport system permease protein